MRTSPLPALTLLVLLALLPMPFASPAAEPATPPPAVASLPYRTVADVFDGFAKVKDKDKLNLAVRVVPADGAAPAAPVTLTLQAPDGPVALTLSESGELERFPLTPALREANPRIVSNQPKGSLTLRAELTLRYSGRLQDSAGWYADALAQANAAVRGQAGLLSHVSPKLTTLVIGFDPAAQASVTLRTDAGEQRFAADARGIARVPLGPEATRRSARIAFSVEPRKIIAE